MAKKFTQEEYLERLKKVRPDYDTSLVKYVNATTKITLICEKGHKFEQLPLEALKYGCRICSRESKKKLVFGVGINDLGHPAKNERCYQFWILMLRRCYDEKYLEMKPSYRGCYVSEEFKYLSKFKEWFDNNYIEGYQLDKDILSPKNDVHYSAETCCFIPPHINSLVRRKTKSKFTGVELRGNKYLARHQNGDKILYLGMYDTEEEAILVCTKSREDYIKRVAEESYRKGEINKMVYETLVNFKIEITK